MNKKQLKKVCMLSFRHGLLDDRIYKKEACTLKRNGYSVVCIGYGIEEKRYTTSDGIQIIQLKKENKKNTFKFFNQLIGKEIFEEAKKVSANIYHLHDVELCRIALKLQNLSNKPRVIYDAHEPFKENFKDYWKSRSLFRIVYSDLPSLIAEKRVLSKLDYLIATEENVLHRFKNHNKNSKIVYNYSLFSLNEYPLNEKMYDAVYCGTLLKSKGIIEMIDLLILLKQKGYNLKFLFIGAFFDKKLETEIQQKILNNQLQQNVHFTGNIPFEEIGHYYLQSKISICLFPLNRTNKLILPIKLFEYMAYGLPIIGSNFGHIADVIVQNNIGEVANPSDLEKVAESTLKLLKDHKTIGEHCISVSKQYTWKMQEPILLEIYNSLG